MKESTISRNNINNKILQQVNTSQHDPKNLAKIYSRPRSPFSLVLGVCFILALLLSACGPTPEELAAFQTVTAMAAFTPTPLPSPTPAGITPW